MFIMQDSFQVETPYIPNDKGCRLIWRNENEEERVVYLREEELVELNEILSHDSTAKIELEDGISSVMVNSDTTEFFVAHRKSLQISTEVLKQKVIDFISKNTTS